MTTRITQLDGDDGGRALLRVEGSLGPAEVELLEQVCADLKERSGREVLLDLAGRSFLDGASASVLARLRRERKVSMKGLHYFVRQVIEVAERADEGRAGSPNGHQPGK